MKDCTAISKCLHESTYRKAAFLCRSAWPSTVQLQEQRGRDLCSGFAVWQSIILICALVLQRYERYDEEARHLEYSSWWRQHGLRREEESSDETRRLRRRSEVFSIWGTMKRTKDDFERWRRILAWSSDDEKRRWTESSSISTDDGDDWRRIRLQIILSVELLLWGKNIGTQCFRTQLRVTPM